MTIFGPINDLFSSKEDRAKLLESRNIQLARLDSFSSTEGNFNTSVAQAKQSIQEKKNDNLLANNTPQPLPNLTTSSSPPVTPQPLASTTTEQSTTIPTTPPLAATENTQQPLSSKEEERIRTVAEKLNTTTPTQNTSATLTTEEPSTLSQVLDVVNPLQHIPFINLAYREATGDTITPASKIIGGTLFGGLLGGVGAIAGAGAAVGFTSGVADASFTQATGIETSSAAAKLYKGESFDAQDKDTFTASSKNTASDAIASSENKKSFTPTFDARHVYADVLRKFGTDIDVLLAHSPDSYGAQVVYSNAIAHVDSLSSQQLVAHKPQDTTTTQEQLAFLHSRIPSATTANTTNTQNTQPVASLYSTSSPLVIKDEALQRLAAVRQNLNIPQNQTATAASDTPASPAIPSVANAPSAPTNDITSLIERRLSQLINAKENGAISSLYTAAIPPSNTPVASSSELPLNTLPQNTNLASLNPTPQATPAVQQDPVADVMKQRLEQFNARRQQQINNGAADHVVSTPLPATTNENAAPQKVSQAPASEAVAQEKNSLQPERLASAMRDAFSRLGRGLVARN